MLWRSGTPLWMICLTATLTLGSGCVIDDDDDAKIVATWDVAFVGGGRVRCDEAGTDWVRLEGRARRNAHTFTYDFPCSNGQGKTEREPAGSYDIRLSLLDKQMRPMSEIESAFEILRYGSQELQPVRFEVQSFVVNWVFSLEKMGAMQPASCGDVGVKTVELFTQWGSTDQREKYPFQCDPGVGVTQAIRSGNYAYQVRLLDAAGQMIVETPVRGITVDKDTRPQITEVFAFK